MQAPSRGNFHAASLACFAEHSRTRQSGQRPRGGELDPPRRYPRHQRFRRHRLRRGHRLRLGGTL
ncbi:MAG TPA: hypothetical protein DIC59_14175, partial [Candidatus Competibacteraceae bacterium]|nr:hypothetical protein [Candidatus Competibacteraceae bacterium]